MCIERVCFALEPDFVLPILSSFRLQAFDVSIAMGTGDIAASRVMGMTVQQTFQLKRAVQIQVAK